MSDYRILLLTSDKYIEAVLPYAHQLKKYWPNHPNVLVCGFSYPDFPMPDGFEFHSIGRFGDYPVNKWSNALIDLFQQIPDEVFLLTLEDMWIIEPVKADVMQICFDYMRQFEYVARLDVTGDRMYAGDAKDYNDLAHFKLIWSNPKGQYHMSMMPGFWRKKHLLEALVPDENPWEVEINGTPRLGNMAHKCIVLGTDQWPLKNTLAFRSGDSSKLLLDEIKSEDVTELRELGLLEEWE